MKISRQFVAPSNRFLALGALAGVIGASMIACSGGEPKPEGVTESASGLTLGVAPQALLNEVAANPPSVDQPFEYVEIKCAPGATLSNLFFVSMEGDATAPSDAGVGDAAVSVNGPPGTADLVIGLDGVVCGTNGIVVIKSATGGHTSDPASTVVTNAAFDTGGAGLENGSNSFLLVESATAIAQTTDYDANDDGALELPGGATLLDGVGWTDGGAIDIVYGAHLTQPSGSIDAATRFPADETQNSVAAWYCGHIAGTGSDSVTYSSTTHSTNFPPDGALTPGAINVGTPAIDAGVLDGSVLPDAASDGGIIIVVDAGLDAGAFDASLDAGAIDAALDAGPAPDAGVDAGVFDAGTIDAGSSDAGGDGGAGSADGLVLSQVYGGGGNSGATYDRDFVEIFNRSSSAISLAGLAVMYGGGTNDFGSLNSDGGAPDTFALPTATIAPGQYFLVGLSSTSATGAALPAVDADGNVALGATNGKVALVVGTAPLGCGGTTRCGSDPRIVDMVGYGTGTDFEGAAAAPSLGNTKAAFRKGQGCVDTNDNAADFTTGTPAPRNSATALVDCSALPVDAGTGSNDAGSNDAGAHDGGTDSGTTTGTDAGGGADAGGTTTDAGNNPVDASAPTGGQDSGASTSRADSGASGNDAFDTTGDSSGCSCRVAGERSNGAGELAFAGFAALIGGLVARRRRRG